MANSGFNCLIHFPLAELLTSYRLQFDNPRVKGRKHNRFAGTQKYHRKSIHVVDQSTTVRDVTCNIL